jgi:2-polyprenyl-6-methoxyphenol hydroxylase-like FAD-dependent oxidoreductase
VSTSEYDLVTVGGGIGGATLAKVMAEAGHRVLVLERDAAFRDRVRGEVLVPWGCREAARLGIYDLLRHSCGHEIRYWASAIGGVEILRRDLVATIPGGFPVLTFYHPEMQECLIEAARSAGARVLRGAVAKGIDSGARPRVQYEHDSELHEATARIVVGADGRSSAVRKWAGFPIEHAEQRRWFAGILMDGLRAPEDTMYSRFAPQAGMMSWIFPQGGARVRTYVGFPYASDYPRLQGERDIDRFIATSIELGVPPDFYESVRPAGPLATFDATDVWVRTPYVDGVALIGDAAATSDPTWGQGMALALHDVRILRDALKSTDDWDAAARRYCEQHDRDTSTIRAADTWYTDVFLDVGTEADERRSRAFPRILEDPSRIPEAPLVGPEVGADESVRRRFFGEDAVRLGG